MRTAISTRQPKVAVEYDCYNTRAIKEFTNPYEARRFYVLKLKQGKNPKIKKESDHANG
jgi:hypothetical protein